MNFNFSHCKRVSKFSLRPSWQARLARWTSAEVKGGLRPDDTRGRREHGRRLGVEGAGRGFRPAPESAAARRPEVTVGVGVPVEYGSTMARASTALAGSRCEPPEPWVVVEQAARAIRNRKHPATAELALEVHAVASLLVALQQASRSCGVEAPQRVSLRRLRLWALMLSSQPEVARLGGRTW